MAALAAVGPLQPSWTSARRQLDSWHSTTFVPLRPPHCRSRRKCPHHLRGRGTPQKLCHCKGPPRLRDVPCSRGNLHRLWCPPPGASPPSAVPHLCPRLAQPAQAPETQRLQLLEHPRSQLALQGRTQCQALAQIRHRALSRALTGPPIETSPCQPILAKACLARAWPQARNLQTLEVSLTIQSSEAARTCLALPSAAKQPKQPFHHVHLPTGAPLNYRRPMLGSCLPSAALPHWRLHTTMGNVLVREHPFLRQTASQGETLQLSPQTWPRRKA